MKILSNILNIFRKKETGKVNPVAAEIYQSGRYETGYAKKKELLQSMEGWVYASVNAIADELAGIKIKLYKRNGDKTEEIKDSLITDVLYKVNDFTTKYDMFWLIGAYLELTGEAPLFLEKDKSGVTGIYFLRPDKITPVADKTQIISGYKYDVGMGKKILLEKDEVIFLKYPNPAKPFRGLGTLEAAARTVDVDDYAETWNMNFFKHAARPDSILTVDQPQMTKDQKNILKNSIKKEYEGTDKAHKMMVLFGNMKLDKFAVNQKDMDFLEQQKYTRDKILGIFRVPKSVLAQTEGVNYASAKVGAYIFARWTIKPKMERIIQQFNEFFIPLFSNSENLYLDFENPIPEDDEAKTNMYSKAVNRWMTINEIRDAEELPPIENGDEMYLPMNLLPIGESQGLAKSVISLGKVKSKKEKNIIPTERLQQLKSRKKYKIKEKTEKDKTKIKEKIKDMLKTEIVKNGKEENIQWDGRKKIKFWHAKNKIFIKYVRQVRDEQKKVFEEQRKEVLKKLREKKAVEKKIDISVLQLDKEEETKKTIKVILPTLETVFKEGADETFNFLDVDMEMDVTKPEVQKLLKSKCREFSKATTATTNIFIKDEVAEGLRLNESIPDISKRINKIFDKAQDYRAERIARTETVRYNSAATQEAFKQSGVVEAKIWTVEPGCCQFCAPLEGKIVDLKNSFFDKGDTITGDKGGKMTLDYGITEYPPLHPSCKCGLSPQLIE